MKLVILIVGITILITVFLIFGLSYLQEEGRGRIELNHAEYDAGIVSITTGNLVHTFEIRNSGQGDLKLSDIQTSCGCTTAILKKGDRVSPKFGMPGHGVNPSFWSDILKPGEKAELEVTFDLNFHGPQATGPAVRVVYLSTDDPQNKKVELKLFADVTP